MRAITGRSQGASPTDWPCSGHDVHNTRNATDERVLAPSQVAQLKLGAAVMNLRAGPARRSARSPASAASAVARAGESYSDVISRLAGEAGAGAERGVWAYPLRRADPAATTLTLLLPRKLMRQRVLAHPNIAFRRSRLAGGQSFLES